MPHAKGMHPGAIWRKSDLQVHSPRDPQWNGGPHFPGGSVESEANRDAWADAFIKACIDKNLDIVALTDHHDMCALPYILKAIARLPLNSPKPWVFPGMEVTCDDSAQCLVIFSVHTDAQLWNRLYGGHLLNIQLPDPDAATNPQAIACGRNVDDFLEEISNDIHLAPHLIVLPNAGNNGSHKTIIRQGFAARFRDLSFDGVYLDKGYDQLDEVTRNKIHGEIKEWGSRRRGIIPTGDNRAADFGSLGGNDCWIKLGEPTAEGLRQAVLADEARITYTSPEFPSQRVIELNITSTLCGNNFRLLLNDGFNAFIGGRGSGKSAILEYLRFGIGRSTGDVTDDQDEESDRQRNLIADTLSNGYVSVVLERDGVRETWTRHGIDSSTIEVLISGSKPEQITIEAAQQRFRARAFSQKQLSTLVNSRRLAAQQITGIAAAESIDRRQSLEQDITKSKRSVTTAFQRVVQLWTVEADSATSVGLVQDLERRRDASKRNWKSRV